MESTYSNTDLLRTYYRSLGTSRPLDPEEELALARRYRKRGEAEAAQKLVRANLRLVVKIARSFGHTGSDLLDLIQEGNTGLVLGVSKFDPDRGVKLSTYVSYWIRAFILRYLVNKARLVKLGTTQAQRKLYYNLERARRQLVARGLEPSAENVAEWLGVKVREVEEVERRLRFTELSLDASWVSPSDRHEGSPLYDELPTPHPTADDLLERQQRQQALTKQLGRFEETLERRERYIYEKRLTAERPMTLRRIGEEFGISRERVRQIELSLRARLRRYLRQTIGDHLPAEAGDPADGLPTATS